MRSIKQRTQNILHLSVSYEMGVFMGSIERGGCAAVVKTNDVRIADRTPVFRFQFSKGIRCKYALESSEKGNKEEISTVEEHTVPYHHQLPENLPQRVRKRVKLCVC